MAYITDRRGTAAEWTAANPVLLSGEEGFETDTRRRKTGNGTSRWTNLAYDDAYATDRSHHTGTQDVGSIAGLLEYIQDQIGKIVPGANMSVVYDDNGTGLTTIASSGGSGGGLTTAQVQAIVAAMIKQGTNVTVVKNVAGDQLTINSTGGGSGTVIKTYATEAAATAGLAAGEFADGDLVIVGP